MKNPTRLSDKPPSQGSAPPAPSSPVCHTPSERSWSSSRPAPGSYKYSTSPSPVEYAAHASTASAQTHACRPCPSSPRSAVPASAAETSPCRQLRRNKARHSPRRPHTTAPPAKQCPPPPAASRFQATLPPQSKQSATHPSHGPNPQSP